MKKQVTRRNFLATAGTAALAATATTALAAESGRSQPVKILGIACSPRKGMTTAKSVQAALDAARALDAASCTLKIITSPYRMRSSIHQCMAFFSILTV